MDSQPASWRKNFLRRFFQESGILPPQKFDQDQVPLAARRYGRVMMHELPLGQVYQWLEPGPVVLLATARKGRANVMTMSWHMMVDFEPPLVACIVSEGNFSFTALMKTLECVIAIPGAGMAETVVGIGNCSGREIDKFERFELTRGSASEVAAPLIMECAANLECRVKNVTLVKQYNLFVLEVLKAWIDPRQHEPRAIHHRGHGVFAVDGDVIRLKSAMP